MDYLGEIRAVDLVSGESWLVLKDAMDAAYVDTGHLLFMRDGALMPVAFRCDARDGNAKCPFAPTAKAGRASRSGQAEDDHLRCGTDAEQVSAPRLAPGRGATMLGHWAPPANAIAAALYSMPPMQRENGETRILPSPRITRFALDYGSPGSVLHTTVLGAGLRTLREILFSGSGVTAIVLGQPSATRADVAITIDPDAHAGPRRVLLHPSGLEQSRGAALFHVLPLSSHAGISGIGSHLI